MSVYGNNKNAIQLLQTTSTQTQDDKYNKQQHEETTRGTRNGVKRRMKKNTHKQVNWNCVLCDLLNTFNSVVIRFSPRAKRFSHELRDHHSRSRKKYFTFLLNGKFSVTKTATKSYRKVNRISVNSKYTGIFDKIACDTFSKCEKAKISDRINLGCQSVSQHIDANTVIIINLTFSTRKKSHKIADLIIKISVKLIREPKYFELRVNILLRWKTCLRERKMNSRID